MMKREEEKLRRSKMKIEATSNSLTHELIVCFPIQSLNKGERPNVTSNQIPRHIMDIDY